MVKYIDYDLDIKLFEDGTTRLLDVAEYNKHASEQGYSQEIKAILEDSVNKVYELIKNRDFPFVDEKIREYYDKFEKEVTK